MVKLVAATEVYYGGRIRKPNEEFDATPIDAKILKGTDKAKDAPNQTYETTAMEPIQEPIKQETPVVEASSEEKEKPRRYRRRDMTAEE